ncbi:hypothetical protein FACS1894207_2330 [Bacteroidia bacterium]|nr:hypothetical protein FACS1894207_2330 [Bacteroidia bacterium]
MKSFKKNLLAAFVAVMFTGASIQAQVVIGAYQEPQSYSVLELISNGSMGFRLPQLTTSQRDAITDAGFKASDLAKGLVIYNTTNECVEYWSSVKWVSLCKGQAHITFSPNPPNGSPFPPEGEDRGPFVPSDNPNCTTETPAYTFAVMTGTDFLHVQVENESTGAFRVSMDENPAATSRNAILRITNNCTQEYKEFLFSQSGDNAGCGTTPSVPDIQSENGSSLCGTGAAYLYLQGRPAGNYIWTLNGREVGRGTEYIATQGGTYVVYGDKIGCPASKSINVMLSGSGAAPASVAVIAGINNGYVCATGGTIPLFSSAATSGVIHWYKNGVRTALTGSPIDAEIGTWFAVVEDGLCSSQKSNSVTVQLDPAAGQTGITPFNFKVNGVIPSGNNINLCAGGSLLLEVENPEAGVTYTWYAGDAQNGLTIGTGATISTTVIAVQGYPILQCVASKTNACTQAQYAQFNISTSTPPAKPIVTSNTGAVQCGSNTQLTAVSAGADSYKWYKDGVLLPGETTNSHVVSALGDYTVYAVSAGNCVSDVSATFTVSNSTGFSQNLSIAGNATPYTGTSETYTATMTNAVNGSYRWSIASGDAQMENTSGNTASIKFGSTDGTVVINVSASNACGDATPKPASLTVTSSSPCSAPSVVAYSPASKELTVPAGTNPTLSITANTNGQPVAYIWYRNTSKSTAGAANLGPGTSSLTGQTALVAGTTYYFYCEVRALCGNAPLAQSDIFTVNVSLNPNNITAIGNGTLSGKSCFDIAESNDNANSCGSLAARASMKAHFATMGVQNYTFKAAASGTVQNVRYVIQDDEGCVDAAQTPLSGTLQAGRLTNGSSVTIPVYYKTTLNLSTSTPLIVGRTKASAAKVVINIIYNDGAKDVKQALMANIQDCMCCGAKISATEWKIFMCHNLGADESADPFTPAQALHGAMYKWGTGQVALTAAENIATAAAISGWSIKGGTPPSTWVDWDMTLANPCPAGYRVPTRAEWEGVNNTNYNPWSFIGTWANTTTNWTSGVQIGDGLFLPAAGHRRNDNGLLNNRGSHGFYWSSTTNAESRGYVMIAYSNIRSMGTYNKSYGFTVRCIAE